MTNATSLPALLIVEDDATALRQLRWGFDDYSVEIAMDRASALAHVKQNHFPVVLLDLGLPPKTDGATEGLTALSEILSIAPDTKVIVVTGRAEREVALQAIGLGAYDFFRKPVDLEELKLLVKRALQLYRLSEENRRMSETDAREVLPGIIGTSESMRHLCRLVRQVAASEMSVLFIGESGTGKEVLARALHTLSSCAKGPFVAINCAAIPEQLLESELFGYERGAFTGAVRTVKGRFELARAGTLFLDEIGDMPPALQVKLLRVLQERVMQRVGGRQDIPLEVRIVCATHKDLIAGIEEGTFREDLYYRLSEFNIEIPPLRDRPEDIVVLAHHYFERYRAESGALVKSLAPDAIAALVRHPWPGNVRELENRIKRAVLVAKGPNVSTRDLDLAAETDKDDAPLTLEETRHHAERLALLRVWAEVDGNVSRASKLLGISRPTAYKLLREHGFIE